MIVVAIIAIATAVASLALGIRLLISFAGGFPDPATFPRERAAALLRNTDHSVADVCLSVGLQSIGSFTTSFKRMYGKSPTAYRAQFPPASQFALVPACVVHAYARPQRRTFREDRDEARA